MCCTFELLLHGRSIKYQYKRTLNHRCGPPLFTVHICIQDTLILHEIQPADFVTYHVTGPEMTMFIFSNRTACQDLVAAHHESVPFVTPRGITMAAITACSCNAANSNAKLAQVLHKNNLL